MTRFLTTASVLVIGGMLVGCATPNFPIEQTGAARPPGSAPPIPPPPSSSGMERPPSAAPSSAIQSGVLPPPAARGPAPAATELPPISPAPAPYVPPARPPYTPPAYTPPPEPAPAPRYIPAPRPLASGKVTGDSPAPYKVRKGDTLISISRKTGVDVEVLAKANDLKKPYKLALGQTVKLPSKRYYTVESGDTLFALSKRFTMDAADLAEFNDLTQGAPIRAGQKIYLPADAKDKGPPPQPKPILAPAPRPRPLVQPIPQPRPEPRPEPAPYTPPAPIPYRPSNPLPIPNTPAPQTVPIQSLPPPVQTPRASTPEVSPPPTEAQIAAAGAGKFVWPVRGDVLSRFGPTGGGQRNDGVNISAQPNETVRAAAQGEVVYAGNQVPGFGNLVLVKHAGGWVTAYAHLSNIDVKMRQAVTQGQAIGAIGQTGSVDAPQLHFEIRYAPTPQDKARPIDPMLVLPR